MSKAVATQGQDPEIQLVGSVLSFPELYSEVGHLIPRPEAFSYRPIRPVWTEIVRLAALSEVWGIWDVISGINFSKSQGLSRSMILEWAKRGVPSETVAMSYAKEVSEQYARRKLIEACRVTIESAEGGAETETLWAGIEAALTALHTVGATDPTEYRSRIEGHVLPIIDGRIDERDYLTTPLPSLNRRITGIYRGDMAIIAAPPSMGKTLFSVQIAEHNAAKGKRILYWSLDQTERDLTRRRLSLDTGVSLKDIKSGRLTEPQKAMLRGSMEKLSKRDSFFHTDATDVTINDIVSMARKLHRTKGLDALFVDYVQQIREHRVYENNHLFLSEVSRQLKALAKELNISVVLASQFSRQWANLELFDRPQVTWLRGSGSLEQDANLILFPWIPLELVKKKHGESSEEYRRIVSENVDKDPLVYVVIGKQKDGPTGEIEARWNRDRVMFYDMADDIPDPGLPV